MSCGQQLAGFGCLIRPLLAATVSLSVHEVGAWSYRKEESSDVSLTQRVVPRRETPTLVLPSQGASEAVSVPLSPVLYRTPVTFPLAACRFLPIRSVKAIVDTVVVDTRPRCLPVGVAAPFRRLTPNKVLKGLSFPYVPLSFRVPGALSYTALRKGCSRYRTAIVVGVTVAVSKTARLTVVTGIGSQPSAVVVSPLLSVNLCKVSAFVGKLLLRRSGAA